MTLSQRRNVEGKRKLADEATQQLFKCVKLTQQKEFVFNDTMPQQRSNRPAKRRLNFCEFSKKKGEEDNRHFCQK